MSDGRMRQTRTLAGWPVRQLVMAGLVLANALWGVWVTRTLIELQNRRIVSVGLTGLVSGFIAAESRRATSPEEAASRTRIYLSALDGAIGELERDGSVVLVKESVLGKAVPDRTELVRRRVDMSLSEGPEGKRDRPWTQD